MGNILHPQGFFIIPYCKRSLYRFGLFSSRPPPPFLHCNFPFLVLLSQAEQECELGGAYSCSRQIEQSHDAWYVACHIATEDSYYRM